MILADMKANEDEAQKFLELENNNSDEDGEAKEAAKSGGS